MFSNLVNTFLKKGLYGLIGNVAYALSVGSQIEPIGDNIETFVWRTIGVAAFTGLVGLLNRLRQWDPTRTQ